MTDSFRVLVDGATGFIGMQVVRRLLDGGAGVRATDLPDAIAASSILNDLSVQAGGRLEVVPSDVTRSETLGAAVSGVDAVVHLAGLLDFRHGWEMNYRVNVEGTRNVCEAAAAAGVRHVIHFSSADVYGVVRRSPADESHPLDPQNPYARSKVLSEEAAAAAGRGSGMVVTIFRPSAVYGERSGYVGRQLLAIPVLLAARGVRWVPGLRGGYRTNLVSVCDVADAVAFALEKGSRAAGAFNLAEDEVLTVEQLFRLLLSPFGIRVYAVLAPGRALLAFAAWLLGRLPDRVFERGARRIESAWERVVEWRGLDPAGRIYVSRDFLGFISGDRWFSNERLKQLGFEFRRRFSMELPAMVESCRRLKWIP